jgi:glycosyltransferase involved in cell wall biosynthesis
MPRPIQIGFLHLGNPNEGINRYGRILAEATRSLGDVEVIERSAQASDLRPASLRSLASAVAGLSGAHATIVQYSRYRLWAPGRLRLLQLPLVHTGLRGRALVVLHDLAQRGDVGRVEDWSLRLNLFLSRCVIVHGAHERDRLPDSPRGSCVLTIPHFIEPRSLPEREHARRHFGVEPDEVVLAMVGWIHPGKNHAAAIETLAALGRRARLWLIGAAPADAERYAAGLIALSRRHGVEDRVEITGYVTDEELDARLAAVDVALCPYTDASTSGSISTLIGAGRRIVATDISAFRDLQRQVDGTLKLVPQLTPGRLSEAVQQILADDSTVTANTTKAIAALSPQAIARKYIDAALGSSPPHSAATRPAD